MTIVVNNNNKGVSSISISLSDHSSAPPSSSAKSLDADLLHYPSDQHSTANPTFTTTAPAYGTVHFPFNDPFNDPFDPFAYPEIANPPMPPPWSAAEPTAAPAAQLLLHKGAPPSHTHGLDHHPPPLGQCQPFIAPAPAAAAVVSHFGSNAAAVDSANPLSALPYTAPALPPPSMGALVPPASASNNNNEQALSWGDQLQLRRPHHPAMPPTPMSMPFSQTHSVPDSLQHTAPHAPAPHAPYAPPSLRVDTSFTTEHVPDQSQISASGSWSPWTVAPPCPEIVVDSNLLLSPLELDYPGSARSGTSSLSSHDPYYYAYLLTHQSPASSSNHHSPYSDFSVLTPSSLISLFDHENSQNRFNNPVSYPDSNAPNNVGYDARLFPTLPSSECPPEDHHHHPSPITYTAAGSSSSHANQPQPENLPYSSTSTASAPNIGGGVLQGLGLGPRNSSENSSDSTLRLSLGHLPHSGSGPAAPAFPPQPIANTTSASAPSFPIPETIEDHDDDPVPEYTGTGAASTSAPASNTSNRQQQQQQQRQQQQRQQRRRKGEAISSVPLQDCFANDPLRRTLIRRILTKPWLCEHKVEPAFLSAEDDVSQGLEQQLGGGCGMKRGDSLLKAFEGGREGQCPFDGCPNVEPRAHRRISHVRTHLGLRPFSCDPRACARCQARIERGLE